MLPILLLVLPVSDSELALPVEVLAGFSVVVLAASVIVVFDVSSLPSTVESVPLIVEARVVTSKSLKVVPFVGSVLMVVVLGSSVLEPSSASVTILVGTSGFVVSFVGGSVINFESS